MLLEEFARRTRRGPWLSRRVEELHTRFLNDKSAGAAICQAIDKALQAAVDPLLVLGENRLATGTSYDQNHGPFF
jgi:hypothetical protein